MFAYFAYDAYERERGRKRARERGPKTGHWCRVNIFVYFAYDAYLREREKASERERAQNWSFSLLVAYVNLDKM